MPRKKTSKASPPKAAASPKAARGSAEATEATAELDKTVSAEEENQSRPQVPEVPNE